MVHSPNLRNPRPLSGIAPPPLTATSLTATSLTATSLTAPLTAPPPNCPSQVIELGQLGRAAQAPPPGVAYQLYAHAQDAGGAGGWGDASPLISLLQSAASNMTSGGGPQVCVWGGRGRARGGVPEVCVRGD